MGKDPSAVVLATALAFCAFCPFFARCDEIELDIKKGIDSLSKVLVKYQAGFDEVKFAELQDTIDEIDKAMLRYKGKAKDKLLQIRPLNSQARFSYENCVGPIFKWCISSTLPFNIFIDKIGDSKQSETNRNIIWKLTVSTLESGLTETGKSLELLTNVQYETAQLKNAIKDVTHDVLDDFSPGGFFSKEKVDLQKRVNPVNSTNNFLNELIETIGLNFIEFYGTDMTQKMRNVTEKVKEIESDLEEDKINIQNLQRVIAGPNNAKTVLLSDMASLRVQFIPNIQRLKDSCAGYVKWLEHDAPFNQISVRTRRSASTFYESEPSPA